MLQVLTTPEFAEWFARLSDVAAESVAVALDLVGSIGPEQAPSDSHEWLLWYEHPCAKEQLARMHVLDHWLGYFHQARWMIHRLQSAQFAERVSRLDAAAARAVAAGMEGLRVLTLQNRRVLAIAAEGPDAVEQQIERARADLRRLYSEILSAAGLEFSEIPVHTGALREIRIRKTEPEMRLVYGVDVERNSALFLVGEPLDRCFYGDSVRRAESVWRMFKEWGVPAATAVSERMGR
jgi:hypothetical protein